MVSLFGAVIDKTRQINQYSDVRGAKYWRDKDGVRHKVTAADGHKRSSTVSSKRKFTDAQVVINEKARKKQEKRGKLKERVAQAYNRLAQNSKRIK